MNYVPCFQSSYLVTTPSPSTSYLSHLITSSDSTSSSSYSNRPAPFVSSPGVVARAVLGELEGAHRYLDYLHSLVIHKLLPLVVHSLSQFLVRPSQPQHHHLPMAFSDSFHLSASNLPFFLLHPLQISSSSSSTTTTTSPPLSIASSCSSDNLQGISVDTYQAARFHGVVVGGSLEHVRSSPPFAPPTPGLSPITGSGSEAFSVHLEKMSDDYCSITERIMLLNSQHQASFTKAARILSFLHKYLMHLNGDRSPPPAVPLEKWDETEQVGWPSDKEGEPPTHVGDDHWEMDSKEVQIKRALEEEDEPPGSVQPWIPYVFLSQF